MILDSTSRFKKDYKRLKKRGYDLAKLHRLFCLLAEGKKLPRKYKNHLLKGEYEGFWECHIEPDWLLIYTISDDQLILTAMRTGTHSDLFN